jgi:branched-chain amino acid transport system permease protein
VADGYGPVWVADGRLLFLRYFGENDEAAEHIGIDVTRIKILAFACSAILMGATGAVMATRWRYIDPAIAFDPLLSFLPVLMAIFGGPRGWRDPFGRNDLYLPREFI